MAIIFHGIRVLMPALVAASLLTVSLADDGPPASQGVPASQRALTRDEELYLLEARQVQLDLEQARNEMDQARIERERVRSLYDQKLVTIEKLNDAVQKHQQAILKHKQAEITIEKKRLEFLKDATLITVIDAMKYRDESGDVMASVTIRNDSDIGKARIAMEGSAEALSDERLASLLKVDNVIVTVLGEAEIRRGDEFETRRTTTSKAIVGDPFQQIVEEIAYADRKDLVYRLLKKDVENVTVRVEFLGTKREYDVFLKKESQQDLPEISSTQYAQIGQLGTKILYDLTLERLAKTEQGFSLVVLNLPPEIKAAFIDPVSEASLTQVKFTEEISKQSLYFEASIPEKLPAEMIDTNISFYIMITHQAELKRIFEVRKQHGGVVPPEEAMKLRGNKVELILIPRGVGKLEILVTNLFKEVERGEPVTLKFNVLNSGTLELRRVTPELDLPLEWEGTLDPTEVAVINSGEKALYTAHINPPPEVEVGEFPVRIEAEGHSGVEIVEAEEKTFTVRVAAQSNITGTAILVGVLVVLVIGIAVASIKISRR